jgi:hypothetical protein
MLRCKICSCLLIRKGPRMWFDPGCGKYIVLHEGTA